MNLVPDDPRAYLKILWRWKFLFLAFVIGAPVVAYAVSSSQAKVYQSSVLVQENTLPVDTSLFASGTTPSPSTAPDAETLGGEARVIETTGVAKLAAAHLNPVPADLDNLLANVTATADPTTGFITITATAPTPARAADIANAFGAAVVTLRTQQAVGLLTTTIDQVLSQIAQVQKSRAPGRSQLSNQLQRLRALRAAQSANAQVLQRASVSRTSISTPTVKVIALGVIAGLLLGLAVVLVAEGADRRIRQPEDLEELTGLPMLAVIPRGAFSGKAHGRLADESFHRLRSALMYFNVDRPRSTILVASAVKGDGKTTVAIRLARAVAQAGRDVIIVDADLRRPQVASRLGLGSDFAGFGQGLAGVLTGQRALVDALGEVPIRDPDDESLVPSQMPGRLRALCAGGIPPNPSELIGSHRMLEVLQELEGLADLVILDTNPLLTVSDALPLLDAVSGVVFVVRLGHTPKDAIRRFQKTIAHTNATVLGFVATDAVGGVYGPHGYGAGYGYTATGEGAGDGDRRGLRRLRHRRRKTPSSPPLRGTCPRRWRPTN